MSDPLRRALMNDPGHWRKRATEARVHADELADVEAKRTMLDIANEYEKLAQRAEDRLITSGRLTDGHGHGP